MLFRTCSIDRLKELNDYSIKEKMKIICSIKTHIISSIPDKLNVQKMIDLPEYSPYLLGELMYRNIIKGLNEESILKFIFLQIKSGGGYDFIQKDKCYYLKMIPLIVIKSQLLYIFHDFFFILLYIQILILINMPLLILIPELSQ